MIMKQFFRRCSAVGAASGLPRRAALVFAIALGACGDGVAPLASAPVAPLTPAAPAAAANSVLATMPEGGEILAYAGQSKTIALDFSASEGSAAGLTLALPSIPGWRAANAPLHCASVSATAGCRLHIIYTPAEPAASSTLPLSYTYTDSTGASREGVYALAYRVLAVNAVVISRQPGGALRGVVGRTVPVTLDFDTSDGEAAVSLKVTTDLAALPAGWKSGNAEFACPGLGRGQACRLALAYSPVAPAGASRLDLAYSYVDSSGTPRSGMASLDYSAILPGSVTASLDASGPLLVKPGDTRQIAVHFRTGDGVRASALRLSADPADTPGWRIGPDWQGCAAVDGSDGCSLTLIYAPGAALGPATLSLAYAYVDNIGEARSGSVEIDYASRLYEAYIADYREDAAGGVRLCTIAADGGLADCTAAQVDLPAQGRNISHILAGGRQAYVASLAADDRSSVFLCAIAADGALEDCRETGGIRTGIRHMVLRGASVYLVTAEGKILRRDVDPASGEIGACLAARGNCEVAGMGRPVAALGFIGTKAYVARPATEPNNIEAVQCGVLPDGDFDCRGNAFLSGYYFAARAMATLGAGDVSRLYLLGEPYFPLIDGRHSVLKCDVLAGDMVGGCQTSQVARLDFGGVEVADIDFNDMVIDRRHAYIVHSSIVFLCDISASDGTLPNCRALAGTGATRQLGLSINRIN